MDFVANEHDQCLTILQQGRSGMTGMVLESSLETVKDTD